MKRIPILLLLALFATASFVGCRPKSDSTNAFEKSELTDSVAKSETFTYSLKKDSCYYLMKTTEEMWPVMGLENKYSVQWPDEKLPREVERELLKAIFGDSTSTSFDEAAARWVKSNEYETLFGDELLECSVVGKIPKNIDNLCYNYVDGIIREDGNLVEFSVWLEAYMGGAHGVHYVLPLVYDRNAGRIIHLSDLVDTTNLGEVVSLAIEDLDVNSEVRECLFDEELLGDAFPSSDDFYIDGTRSTIVLIYQIYDITPYACGTQEVVLPIFWLSKHRKLTPYAKEIFGEGCSL